MLVAFAEVDVRTRTAVEATHDSISTNVGARKFGIHAFVLFCHRSILGHANPVARSQR